MWRAGAFAALVLLSALPARADERIADFASDITVARTGTLTVTETISVIAEGNKIRHGIFRDFPTTYSDTLGREVHVDFTMLSVSLDGDSVAYDVSSIEDGERIKIGDPNSDVSPGAHTYKITYTTDRQIGFFQNYDELYWNVTGNFWDFPIDRARALIRLPDNARVVQSTSYTGAAGVRGENNAKSQQVGDHVIAFETTAPLARHEGLTVAVGFSKGAVLPPTKSELRAQFLRDNAPSIVAVLGVVAMLIYFFVAWYEFGRDPPHGTIIPLFSPPKDFSPAAVRFVERMGYDRKAYAASLVNMAVKSYMKIAESSGEYTLTRTAKSPEESGLSHGEAAIAKALFSSSDSIVLKQSNHTSVASSISALRRSLKAEYERAYFVTNLHWFIGGVAILVISGGAATLLAGASGDAGFLLIWISVWSVGTVFLLHRAFDAWHNVFVGPGSRAKNFSSAVGSTIFALPFVVALIVVLGLLGHNLPVIAVAAMIAGGVGAYVFYHLLKAPTRAGGDLRDHIAGFKLFLNTAEKNRLEVLNPPNVTPAMFEAFLPYAMALDCENQWSKKFEAEAAAAGMTANSSGGYYAPLWYSGAGYNNFGAGVAAGLGASLAASAASAATAPGSSSGSGGGGFSGGGGGGGGGGGW